ncbi:hypothetical protein V1512DRAFT_267366 [Lipomyces arxii]|uniref:uncharacterized protein n=1 Tax=Lipomyces arxii TaxID=56418 RepID=UPI0034CD8FD5
MPKRTRTNSYSSDVASSGDEEQKFSRSEHQPSAPVVIECSLPPHCNASPTHFTTSAQFEQHYIQAHSLLCSQCKRTFPSQRFLDLHLSESHDPFVAARRDRGEKVYECFVEGCDKLCRNASRRRLHLIDKHGYPKEYMFNVVKYGIGRDQKSLLYTKPFKTRIESKVSDSESDGLVSVGDQDLDNQR